MPQFFFDISSGTSFAHDDDGVDLPNLENARMEAAIALAEMARFSGADDLEVACTIRDGTGALQDTSMKLSPPYPCTSP